jgi:hypothetical protein
MLGEPNTPPSLHRYLYAYANPTVYLDWQGNFAVTDWLAQQLNRSADIQSDYVASLDSELGDGFWSDIGVRTKGVAATVTSGLTSFAGLLASGGDQLADAALSGLGDVEILGQNSLRRTIGRVDSAIKGSKAAYDYVTQDDLGGALTNAKINAEDAFGRWVDDVKRGDITATSQIGAAGVEALSGSLITKVGKLSKLSKFSDKERHTYESKGGPLEQHKGNAGGCPCCFAAGTKVLTKNGLKPIEEIQEGDYVASRNEETGEVDWKPVTTLFEYDDDRITYLLKLVDEAGSEEILEVTDNHPFWIEDLGWIESGKLKPGMRVSNYNGGYLTVVELTTLNASPVTYNFEVADFHTYFVGEKRAWVHNQCPCRKDEIAHGGYNNRKAQRKAEYERRIAEKNSRRKTTRVKESDVKKLSRGEDIHVKSQEYADALLERTYPDAQKHRGSGLKSSKKQENEIRRYREARKKAYQQKDSKDTVIYHKDYQRDNDGSLFGHETLPNDHPHKTNRHINVDGYVNGEDISTTIIIDN